MEEQRKLIDFEKARKSVMEILAGKVTTQVAVKVAIAMQEQSVDAVEVVRCKDCEYFCEARYCKYIEMHGLLRFSLGENGFCSRGKRKV